MSSDPLFPANLPSSEWLTFPASGFSGKACGVVYRLGSPLTCGMPLGGIDTGCVDLDNTGLLGYCTIFNTHVPRRGPINLPLLGIVTGTEAWALCHPRARDGEGGSQHSASGRPYNLWRGGGLVKEDRPITPLPSDLKLDGVKTAREINYWGHYPIADLEFETDSPVGVGLRAWCPFLPGDLVSSMIPAIMFEVRLRNSEGARQDGSVVVSFPGPTDEEAGCEAVDRSILDAPLAGVKVDGSSCSYVLACLDRKEVRIGGGLGSDGELWSASGDRLPEAEDASTSVAADFTLGGGEGSVIRFVLSWHSPVWNAGGYAWAGAEHSFTHMYAKHYPTALHAAKTLARGHEELLRRIIAWQEILFTDSTLPVWLRESLVNNLHLLTEDGLWAQRREPLPDWVREDDGLFGMNECPRGCPQIECIPCSFYGNQPLVYFFPRLALSTLRGYKGYQYPDGAPPWIFGGCTGKTPPIDFANPTRGYQFATNGISLATMVDRYMLCHGDRGFVEEFYPCVRDSMRWTAGLRTGRHYSSGEKLIAMPDPESDETAKPPTEWFEAPEPGWFGMTSHVGGLHLAQLRITERMGDAAGDGEFARACRKWAQEARDAMENRLWAGNYYLNFLDPETGRKSDLIFGYQLDGEWIIAQHGLEGGLPEERVRATLDTIRRINVGLSKYGAVNYANPDGTPARIAGYGTYSFFPPEALMLAMTFMYAGETGYGLELARKVWHNIVCRHGYAWDMPNIMRGDEDTGERTFGNDYYQDMMLWSLPAAINREDFGGPARAGGLVDRIIRAAKG
jgi:uncharacterized protein (DUF608 family)